MTRKHTALAVLIALVAITAVPTAFAEIQNNGFGGQILIDAASELENGFTKYKAKMHEIITQVNFNTLAITELQNTSGSDNQVQVDQNSADIQTINATVFWNEGLLANNMGNTAQNTADIVTLFDHSQTFEDEIFGQVSTEGILHDINELQNNFGFLSPPPAKTSDYFTIQLDKESVEENGDDVIVTVTTTDLGGLSNQYVELFAEVDLNNGSGFNWGTQLYLEPYNTYQETISNGDFPSDPAMVRVVVDATNQGLNERAEAYVSYWEFND